MTLLLGFEGELTINNFRWIMNGYRVRIITEAECEIENE
jgi:hypothetical protein